MGNSHVIFRSPVSDLFTPSSAVSNIPTLNYASTNLWTSSVARFAPLPLKTENVHSFPIFPINVKHAPINKNIWERCKTLHGETLTGGFRWRQVMESFPSFPPCKVATVKSHVVWVMPNHTFGTPHRGSIKRLRNAVLGSILKTHLGASIDKYQTCKTKCALSWDRYTKIRFTDSLVHLSKSLRLAWLTRQ